MRLLRSLTCAMPAAANTTEYYDGACTAVWTNVSGAPNCSNASSGSYAGSTFSYRSTTGACVQTGTGFDGCVAAANAIYSHANQTAFNHVNKLSEEQKQATADLNAACALVEQILQAARLASRGQRRARPSRDGAEHIAAGEHGVKRKQAKESK